ncbi:MAG TPA: hypothetical protein VFB50_00230 [Chloroflexota bacterium]|nr:hypothetical protein [Chloroflexota bacterium]
MPGQIENWSCSACSLEWVKRSVGLASSGDIYADRQTTVYEIGYPSNINPQYGLMNADGSALMDVLDRYGQASQQAWLSFDDCYRVASMTTGMISGAAWYHWTALRGVQGDTIWIANSAPGYKSVWNNLGRADWDRLGGFSCVWLV